MNLTSHIDQPTFAESRIAFLDELRGLAVLGMLLINIVGFGLPVHVHIDPSLTGNFDGIDRAVYLFTSLLVEGAFRAIFCVLFGAGVLLQFERNAKKTNPEDALRLHRRHMRWLILFGLINAYLLLWFGDILVLYGLVGLVLLAFRRLSATRLMLIAAALLALLALQNLFLGEEFSDPSYQLMEPEHLDSPSADSVRTQMLAEIEKEQTTVSAGYASAWSSRAMLALMMEVSFIGRALWEALALMLLGMALYKLGAHHTKLTVRTSAITAVSALTIGVAVNAWEWLRAANAEMPLLNQSLWTYDFGRMAVAVFYASLFLLFCKLDWASALRFRLSAVGRMALSN